MKHGIHPAILAIIALAACVAAARAEVPPPPERQAADVVVSGRTSTLVRVDVASAGQEIPRTFSGDTVRNTPGFAWWVSRHWALKTDLPEADARHYLGLLEMAWPHYVELFGREIPEMGDKRLTVCYASTAARLAGAITADGMTWDFRGGGITFEERKCSYVYPAGSLSYHQRYILLHEAAHLYQMCLYGSVYSTPAWYYEGVADSLAGHVYDSRASRLTVHVVDRPTMHNYFDSGREYLARAPISAETIHDTGGTDRGLPLLLFHYLADDPDRAQRLRLWRDELTRQALVNRCLTESARLMQDVFGSWIDIRGGFRKWITPLQPTFHNAEGLWEQDGNTLWSFPDPKGGICRSDVLLIPKAKPEYHPLRMDYPAEPLSPLVGPVERGVAEPAIGCVLDFSRSPDRGQAGIGLGVILGTPSPGADKAAEAEKPAAPSGVRVTTIQIGGPTETGYLAVWVREGKELVMDGRAMGMREDVAAIPPEVRNAMAADGRRVGLTVWITAGSLEATLRAKAPGAAGPAEFKASWPLNPAERERLMMRPPAILSQGGSHGITPFFDDRRRMEPDLSAPAPPNRWRNPGDRRLAALYRAARQLGEKTPPSLLALRQAMVGAADKDPATQKAAVETFAQEIGRVLQDVAACEAPPETVAAVVADLKAAG